MWSTGCRSVQAQLPLLAGGELIGPERRRAERHLITCARCRTHLSALRAAIDAIHAAAEHSPVSPESPSLWPALELEIQESRRALPLSALSWATNAGLAACGLLGLAFGILMLGWHYPARQAIPPSQALAKAAPAAKSPEKPISTSVRPDPKSGITVAGSGRTTKKSRSKPKAPVLETPTFSRPAEDPDRGASGSADTHYTQ